MRSLNRSFDGSGDLMLGYDVGPFGAKSFNRSFDPLPKYSVSWSAPLIGVRSRSRSFDVSEDVTPVVVDDEAVTVPDPFAALAGGTGLIVTGGSMTGRLIKIPLR